MQSWDYLLGIADLRAITGGYVIELIRRPRRW
jgi:hypothetical protein